MYARAMSHYDYDDFETAEQVERRKLREKAAFEFDQKTHTKAVTIRTGGYGENTTFRACVDCKALTFDGEGHRKWHEENESWL